MKAALLIIFLTILIAGNHQVPAKTNDIKSSLKNGDKPNVLFIAIDDLNDWVGCMGGNPQVKTPNLDRLNEIGGMVMSKAHCSATVCCPSRSALLTGAHAHRTGVYGNDQNLRYAPKSKDLVTLPEYFSQNGYISLTTGKIFHRHPEIGDHSGAKNDGGQWAFDEYYKSYGSAAPISNERPVNGLPHLPDEDPNHYHYKAFDWGPTQGNDETKMGDYIAAKWAADQLMDRDFEKPFFMALGISKPHLTWYIPQKYFDMYPLDEVQLPKTISNDLEDILKSNGSQAFSPADSWRRAEAFGAHKEAVRAYMATITFVDDCIGVLLDGLENSKYADNTIVMLWGDHGWYLGEKMRYGKTELWQEACRVPFMVKVPGVSPNNKRCEGVINLIDMYPTLIDLCGLPPNPENDGRSFADLIHNPDMEWNEPTLTTMGRGNHRVFDGRYSYISHKSRGIEQLYDHQLDSMEWYNVIDEPAYADVKARLKVLIPEYDEPEAPLNKDLKPPTPIDTTAKVWVFPGDTAQAWQYDYVRNEDFDTLFSLDESKSIGVYGCNSTAGVNIRRYQDASEHKDAAQFQWNLEAETFQINGQWLRYKTKLVGSVPLQLIVRARVGADTKFGIRILDEKGDTAFYKNADLKMDFADEGGGNEHTNFYSSKFNIPTLWGDYTLYFDWHENIGDLGIFGGFTFVETNLDYLPPEWRYISIGELDPGEDVTARTNEDATIYLVPEGTSKDTTSIYLWALASCSAQSGELCTIATSGFEAGNYIIYAIDAQNNISDASRPITLQESESNSTHFNSNSISISYDPEAKQIQAASIYGLSDVRVFNNLGQQILSSKNTTSNHYQSTKNLITGFYLVIARDQLGNIAKTKLRIGT